MTSVRQALCHREVPDEETGAKSQEVRNKNPGNKEMLWERIGGGRMAADREGEVVTFDTARRFCMVGPLADTTASRDRTSAGANSRLLRKVW